MSVAVVTGGGRGLGRVLAEHLLTAGWQVAVTGRSEDALRQVEGALPLPGDTTDRAHVEAAAERAHTALGPVDLLVANAGRFGVGGPLWQADPDEWWRDAEVNVRGPLLWMSAVLPRMVARGSGRVVVTGSGLATKPVPHGSAYSASKAAAQRLVEATAGELAGTGVTAFSVSPGFVETEMTRGFPPGFTAAHPDMADPEPGRWTPPQRFAALVQRIATGELDALSGRYLHVTTDLDAALAATASEEPGTLRLVPYA